MPGQVNSHPNGPGMQNVQQSAVTSRIMNINVLWGQYKKRETLYTEDNAFSNFIRQQSWIV